MSRWIPQYVIVMELLIQVPAVWQFKKCKEKPDLTVTYKGECQKQG